MNRLFSMSIRAQLFLIVFIVALPAAGIISYSGIKLRKEAIQEAYRETQKLADNIAAEQQNMVSATEQLVSVLAQLPDVKKHNSAKVQSILKNIRSLNPRYSNILIADRAGNVWASAVPVKPFSISDRRYFENALSTGQFSSGEYVIERATAKPSFNFAYPLHDDRGKTVGVISVGFVLDYFRQLIGHTELTAGTSYLLLDYKGVVLGRAINPEQMVGMQYPAEPFKRMLEGPDEDTFVLKGLDRIPRFVTYRKMRLPGEQSPYMYIRAGIPVDVVLSKANRELFSNLALLTSVFLAAFLLASLTGKRSIADRVSLLEKASQRLANGDLQVRVSDLVAGGELGSLGRTFDSMALQLALREQDLRDKNRKLEQEVRGRIRSEEAMRLSEERFETIFNSINDAIFLLDSHTGAILDVNREATDMFGYTREDARQIMVGDLGSGEPPYTQQDAIAWIQRASLGKPQLFEWNCRHRSGNLFWCEINMRITAIGGLDRVLVVVRDIMRRKMAEEKLQESEQRYRMLFESAGDAIFLMQGDSFLDCNIKTLEMFGCPRERILGQPLSRFSPPVQPDGQDSKEKAFEKIAAALTGKPQSFEWEHLKYDGTPFDAEVNLNKIEVPKGTYLLAIVRDVTERKRSEKDLQDLMNLVIRSQKEWRDTVDSITDMILIHDTNLSIIKANKAYAAYLGLKPKEVVQRDCHDLFPHGTASPLLGCSPQLAGDTVMPVIEEIVDANTQRTFSISTFPYFSPEGEAIGSVHIARDITERKEYEMQLIMKERLASLGQMASGIAHEINNPLESVMISAESLLLRVDKDQYDQAIFKKYLQIIDEEVLRCREITGNMLSFARKTSAEWSTVDVHHVIDNALKLIGYQGRLKQVEVKKVYHGLSLILGNEGELRQVCVALIINALDAMENKGLLTIETGTRADDAYIMISDTGPGISRENLAKIFSPFFTTKAASGGTGLGLPIAQKIITSHHGSIQATSGQDHGATFTITLPLLQPPQP
jgi:PAS domain S-box-containing protein